MSIGALSPSSANLTPMRSEPSAQVPSSPAAATPAPANATTTSLSEEALALVDQLKARDTEVRQHEQAHLAASGGLATSGASYTYQRGPNGVNYAIGGEVNIDTAPGSTPQETIQRAQTIEAAALAPAQPSGQDRAVAAAAQQMENQARAQLAQQQVHAYGASGAPSPTVDTYA